MAEELKKNGDLKATLIIHLSLVIATLGVLFFSQAINLSPSNNYSLWSFISIATFCWIVWSWRKVKKGLFNPYGLFLLAVFLFNLSYVLLSRIPGNFQADPTNIFPLDVVTSTVVVVTLSILGLHLGAILAVLYASKHKIEKSLAFSDKDLSIVGYFLLLLSLYPLYLNTSEALRLSVNAGYQIVFQQAHKSGLAVLPEILASFIIPGTFLLLASSKKNKTNRLISLIIIISYTVCQLILGSRSAAIMPLVAYIWLWHKTIKPIRIGLLTTLGSLFLFIIFPIIRVLRNVPGVDKFSWQNINGLFGSTNPFLDALNEMGSTMQITSHTIQLIPKYRQFDLGNSYLNSVTSIFPNIFYKIHPTVQHATFSAWLVSTVNPALAKIGGGLGFSFIAEAYANFGIYGSLATVFVIGFLFVFLSEYVEKSNNRAYLAMLATYLSFFLFFTRAESRDIVREFFWYSLVPILLMLFVQKYRSKLLIKVC
ncbi:MAG: O-antigen polysaccharide polymerase Wzy [Candidatus Berkelbacteria bacterium]|nr:O-antigen polysaccharide polymerase Wzy [Candidatus Berkelbacteria bacterium]